MYALVNKLSILKHYILHWICFQFFYIHNNEKQIIVRSIKNGQKCGSRFSYNTTRFVPKGGTPTFLYGDKIIIFRLCELQLTKNPIVGV